MPLNFALPFAQIPNLSVALPLPASQLVLIAILIVSTTLYVTQWISIELTSMLIIVALLATGVLPPGEALSGFSNSATITVAAMFVVSAGLVRTGALEVATDLIVKGSGGQPPAHAADHLPRRAAHQRLYEQHAGRGDDDPGRAVAEPALWRLSLQVSAAGRLSRQPGRHDHAARHQHQHPGRRRLSCLRRPGFWPLLLHTFRPDLCRHRRYLHHADGPLAAAQPRTAGRAGHAS